MRFPETVLFRIAECKIYGKQKSYAFYRVCGYVAGKRRMSSFSAYSAAKKAAKKLVREIARGSTASALTGKQATDALAALERLQTFHEATGRRVSLLAAVSEFADAAGKVNGRRLADVVEGYLKTVASVERKGVTEAVEEFIEVRKPLTQAKPGKRAQLSQGYAYLVGSWLRRFAKTFPGAAICDLGKDHLNAFFGAHDGHSAKSRNHLRGTVKMFLTWCAKRDYLSQTHRLFEADSMATESADTQEIDYYRPKELQDMLDGAGKSADHKGLLPVIALGGLAGLRLEEALRLEWADVWRVADHIEIKAIKAKIRARRLVEICPSLALWLEPFRAFTGPVYSKSTDTFHETFAPLRESLKIPARRNGLRHAFCTYHFALHSNENLTAALAGNSPGMIHGNYKGLATKKEAEFWFAVRPAGAA